MGTSGQSRTEPTPSDRVHFSHRPRYPPRLENCDARRGHEQSDRSVVHKWGSMGGSVCSSWGGSGVSIPYAVHDLKAFYLNKPRVNGFSKSCSWGGRTLEIPSRILANPLALIYVDPADRRDPRTTPAWRRSFYIGWLVVVLV